MLVRKLILVIVIPFIFPIAMHAGSNVANAQGVEKVRREIDFLSSTKRAKEILNYLHWGATYVDHDVIEVLKVTNSKNQVVPGHVALKVTFDWKWSFGENTTKAIIFFNELGEPYEIQSKAADTTSLTAPFSAADGVIQILGNVLIAAFGDSMNAKEKADMQKAIDDADSRELLIASLKIQFRLGL